MIFITPFTISYHTSKSAFFVYSQKRLMSAVWAINSVNTFSAFSFDVCDKADIVVITLYKAIIGVRENPLCCSSNSIPMNLRPNRLAAAPVVPLPIQQSSTRSPSLLDAFMRYSINLNGFCVGCRVLFAVGNLKTAFLQCSLNVAPLFLPNKQHSMPLNHKC